MSAFDLFPTEAAAKMERHAPVDLNETGFFTGSLSAPAKGLAKGLLVEPARVMNLGMSLIPAAIDQAYGTNSRDWWFENMMLERASRAVTPNPREVGMAGQILHSLTDVGGQAIVGGPALVGISKTVGKSIEGVEEGLDPLAAMKKGAIEGGSAALGVALPISLPITVGSRIPGLAQQLAYGVASNVPLGIASRALTHEVLAKDYPEMAEQYKALDEGALATDLVLGLAFGGLGHAIASKGAPLPLIRPSDIDAALTRRNAYHIEVDAAPGLAKNGETRDAHVESVLKATEDLIAGRPVDVSETLRATDFEPHHELDKARTDLQAQTEKVAEPIWREADATRVLEEAAATRARGPEADQLLSARRSPYVDLVPGFERLMAQSEALVQRAKDIAGGNTHAATDQQVLDAIAESRRAGAALAEVLTKPKGELAPAAKTEALGAAKPIEPARAAQIQTSLKAEGVAVTPENVQTVHMIARAHELDAAAVDALPDNLPDAEYLAKLKEIVDAKQATETPDQNRQVAAGAGPGAGGGEARPGAQEGQGAGRQPAKAAGGGEGAGAVEAAEVRGAEELAAAHPDMLVTLEDGTTATAAAALAKADEVIAQAEHDARGFEAAVMCATRRGG